MARVDFRRDVASGAAHPQALHDIDELVRHLIRRRHELGMTQAALADRLGTSQRTVSQLENRAHDPKVTTVIAWGCALGLRLTAQEHRS